MYTVLSETDDSASDQVLVIVRLGDHRYETSQWWCVLRWIRGVEANIEFTSTSLQLNE